VQGLGVLAATDAELARGLEQLATLRVQLGDTTQRGLELAGVGRLQGRTHHPIALVTQLIEGDRIHAPRVEAGRQGRARDLVEQPRQLEVGAGDGAADHRRVAADPLRRALADTAAHAAEQEQNEAERAPQARRDHRPRP